MTKKSRSMEPTTTKWCSEKCQVCARIFNAVEHSIKSLNLICNQIMKPYSAQLESSDWGLCEEEQKKEFTHIFDKFCKELKEAIASLSGVISLQKYDQKWESDVKKILNSPNPQTAKNIDPDMKKHFQELFASWIEDIKKYTDPHGVLSG